MNQITISRGEYELLIRDKAKLEMVKKAIANDDASYGLNSDTRTVLEFILGIEKAD